MKTIITAAAIALATVSFAIAPASADSCKTKKLKNIYEMGKQYGAEDAKAGLGLDPTKHGDVYDGTAEGDCFTSGYSKGYQKAANAANNSSSTSDYPAGSNEEAYYKDGCAAGKTDRKNNQSMAYERHSGDYDSRFEAAFAAGYNHCWMK